MTYSAASNGAALFPQRFAVDTLGQLALSLLALIAGTLTATLFLPKPPGPPGWLGLALGTILAGALRLDANPIGGVKVTQAFLLAGVVASGVIAGRCCGCSA